MSVAHGLALAYSVVIADLSQRLVTDLNILLEHMRNTTKIFKWLSKKYFSDSDHGFVGDVAVLLEAGLALLLLGGHVVGDEGVVALLAELVGALHLLLVHRLLHLHHLVHAPHLLPVTVHGVLWKNKKK